MLTERTQTRDAKFWIGAYQNAQALWMTDNNPRRPHALLTSGLHSGGFFNSRRVIPDEALLALIDHPMPSWSAMDCPLCKAGSTAIPAKNPENWALLNATYEEVTE